MEMRILILGTTIVLAACSAQNGQNNAAAGNASASVPAPAAPSNGAAASAPTAGAVQAYTAIFAERWPAGPAVSPADVRAMLTARGARATVQALSTPGEGPNRWNSVVRGVALGDQAWLDLVPQLRNGTDAGTTDDIVIALSDAIVSNPAGALRLFAPHPADAENFCTENGFETPAAQSRAYYAAAIAAVDRVTDRDLQAIKSACLTNLRAGAARPVTG
jgi:hypothetical protein